MRGKIYRLFTEDLHDKTVCLKICPAVRKEFTRSCAALLSVALSTVIVAIILAITRLLAYTSADRGWSPPYNRLGQADDSYADRLVEKVRQRR